MIYQLDQEGKITDDFRDLLLKLLDEKKEDRHSCYIDSVEHAEELSVHLYGKTPDKLLDMVRPREDPEVKKYRKQAYQPTTKATAEKALSMVSKIFNPTLSSIQWKNQTKSGKELESYTKEYYPFYNSVVTFMQQTALKKMLADPNGVMCVKPYKKVLIDSERPQPVAFIYGSSAVWYFDEDMFLILKKMQMDRKGVKTFYFEYFDKEFIRELEVRKISPKVIEVTEDYTFRHLCNDMPIWHLRGVPHAKDDGTVYYRSFFDAALPFWNQSIIHESDLLGAYINHMHPIRAELAEECDYIDDKRHKCKAGFLYDEAGTQSVCPSCKGTGHKSVKGPYGVYMYNREKLSTDGGAGLTPVEYITVPTEPTKMLEERVDKLLEKGLYALNMDVLNKIGENQSGVAKVIDRDELYDFLYRIGVVMFDIHLANVYDYTNSQMFGVSDAGKSLEKNLPEILKPVKFDISSALEIMEEMKVAKDSGANPQYIREKQKQVNAKEFASAPDIKQRLDLELDLDPCPELDVDNITLLVDKGQISKENAYIHNNIERLIDRALEEKNNFQNMKKSEQLKILQEYAKEELEEMKPSIDTNAIEDDTGSTGGQAGQNDTSGNPSLGEGGGQNPGQDTLPPDDSPEGT